jgi:hypothetical protein
MGRQRVGEAAEFAPRTLDTSSFSINITMAYLARQICNDINMLIAIIRTRLTIHCIFVKVQETPFYFYLGVATHGLYCKFILSIMPAALVFDEYEHLLLPIHSQRKTADK